MSLELYDADGSMGKFATVSGYSDLVDLATLHGGPALRTFVKQGYSTDLEELKKDVAEALKDARFGIVSNALKAIESLLANAKDIVIVQ